MSKTVSNSTKRKTRSDKFPLTLHPTRQYCKKIKGKLYYFGTNKQEALQRYLEDAVFLHSGKGQAAKYTYFAEPVHNFCYKTSFFSQVTPLICDDNVVLLATCWLFPACSRIRGGRRVTFESSLDSRYNSVNTF